MITKDIKNISDIVEAFAAFKGFDNKTHKEFSSLRNQRSIGANSQLDLLLRRILNDETPHVCLCLLEQELRKTGQQKLIEKVTGSDSRKDGL